MTDPSDFDDTRAGGPKVADEGIGARLRAQRQGLALSLREVARRVGVSASLISQIELGRVHPSVNTLHALASELGLTMSELLDTTGSPAQARVEAPPGTYESPGAALVVEPDARAVISLSDGVRWERLTAGSDARVEFMYLRYGVGSASCPEDSVMQHAGREYGYVISGRLGIRVGEQIHELGPGASISFDSSIPHRFWTIGDEPVDAIWFVLDREPAAAIEAAGALFSPDAVLRLSHAGD